MNLALQRLIGQTQPYPPEHRRNFILLYLDISGWGVLNGSTLVFLAVYMSRLGASPVQVGLLTSAPALVNLLFTFPTNLFAQGRSAHTLTCWSALITRLFYALLIPLPVILAAQMQIWAILLITLVMSIPSTMAVVIGNAFFAEVTPPDWRAHVVGVRNALLAVTSMVTSLLVGQILKWLPFETGYLVVFALGFIGAMVSVLNLFLIRPVLEPGQAIPETQPKPPGEDLVVEGIWKKTFRWEIWRGPFARVLLMMFFLYMAFYLPGPITPLFQVQHLKLSDETISLGASLFWVVYFIGSTQSGGLAPRLGFKNLTGFGTLGIFLSTLVFLYSYPVWLYMASQLLGGIGWALLGGGLINYLLEKIPAHDRPPYLAWYNLVVNAAVLLCGLLAPQLSNLVGLFWAMGACAAVALVAGVVILKWG